MTKFEELAFLDGIAQAELVRRKEATPWNWWTPRSSASSA